MLIASPSASAKKVTFKSKGCCLVNKLAVGNNIIGFAGGVFIIVNVSIAVCTEWKGI